MGLVGAVDVLGERLEDAERVLQPVPARDLGDQRVVEPQWRVLDQRGGAL
jgi:hypothetical protein